VPVAVGTGPTLTDSTPAPEPRARLNVSQLTLSLAAQLSVPPPVLLILNVWAAGFTPPWVAVKERLVVLAPMAGGVTGGGGTGPEVFGGGDPGSGGTGGGAAGGTITGGVKMMRLLLPDSLLDESKAVTK